jgi:hypothetical protein
MAAAVFSDAGLEYLSDVIGNLGVASAVNWRFKLFVNNYTPVVTSVIGDFTEPSNTGYAEFTGTGWTTPASVAGIQSSTVGNNTWTFTANALTETVYGWTFEIEDASSVWHYICAKNLSVPYLIPPGGGTTFLTFTFTFQALP